MERLGRTWTKIWFPEDPVDLEISQWDSKGGNPSLAFVIFRWISLLCIVAITTASMVTHEMQYLPGTWFLYWTHWGLLSQVVHFATAALITSVAYRRNDYHAANNDQMKTLPLLHLVMSISASTGATIATGISVSYWHYVYDPNVPLEVMTFMTHCANGLLEILDILVSARVAPLWHVALSPTLLVFYCFTNYMYWHFGGLSATGEKDLYPYLPWDKPTETILQWLLGIAILVSMYFLIAVFVWLRKSIWKLVKKYDEASS